MLIAESIPHIVWVATSDGSTEYINRRGTDYTGLPREDLYEGADWTSLIHPDDLRRAQHAWQNATRSASRVRADETYESECRLRRSDGEYRWHACRASPVRDPEGGVVKWIGTATDIEEQKTLEVGLVEAQRQAVESSAFLNQLQAVEPLGSDLDDRDKRDIRMDSASRNRTQYLTDREREVLAWITQGLSNKAIAAILHVAPNTVRNHVQRILFKLNVHSRLEAVVVATREPSV
jgi:PAS domain S-box-containing protein